MKTLIICISIHHGNTERIARAMAQVLEAQLLKPSEVDGSLLSQYELVGWGSGIYRWRHHRILIDLADELPVLNKRAFIFSTRGNLIRTVPVRSYHKPLEERLLGKGLSVVGQFSCLGLDTAGPPQRLVGGINKGRPDKKDLENAARFAASIKNGTFTEMWTE